MTEKIVYEGPAIFKIEKLIPWTLWGILSLYAKE